MPNKATDNQRIQFTPPSAATYIETPTSPGDGTVSDQARAIINLVWGHGYAKGSGDRIAAGELSPKKATQQIQNLIEEAELRGYQRGKDEAS